MPSYKYIFETNLLLIKVSKRCIQAEPLFKLENYVFEHNFYSSYRELIFQTHLLFKLENYVSNTAFIQVRELCFEYNFYSSKRTMLLTKVSNR